MKLKGKYSFVSIMQTVFMEQNKSHKKNMEIFSIFKYLTTMEIKFRQLYLDR